MKFRGGAIAAILGLAGCGQAEVDLKDASVEEVVRAAEKAETLSPGKWSMQYEVLSVELPGMPDQEKRMMKAMTDAMLGRKDLTEQCLTPEQAKAPPPEMFAGAGGAGCKFERFALDNGEMNATMICTGPGTTAGGMKMAMKGQYGGESINIEQDLEMNGLIGGNEGAGIRVKARSIGKRVGDC